MPGVDEQPQHSADQQHAPVERKAKAAGHLTSPGGPCQGVARGSAPPTLSAASTLWPRRIQSLIIATMRRTLEVEVCHNDGAGAGWSIGDVGTSSGWLVTGMNSESVISAADRT